MNIEKHNILILDGGHKKTLAIVRTLGRTGKYVLDVAALNRRAISFFSRYTDAKITLPDPRKNASAYQSAIINRLRTKKYLTVIPSDYLSFQLCAEIKSEIELYSHICISEPDLLRNAGNKQWVYERAKSLNIPVPESEFLSKLEDLETLDENIKYVLKSAEESGDSYLQYPENIHETKSLASQFLEANNDKTLIAQRKIIGDGYGFFAFYKEGSCINHFIHHRIREYPPSGGASTTAEGIYDKEVERLGKKILNNLNWNGVAMVEFKRDNQRQEYQLLEINAKFWGSLDLAIASGVDFPLMWVDDAKGNAIPKIERYSTRRFQWILNGELFHIFARPLSIGRVLKDLLTSENDIILRDIKPNVFQLINIPMHYLKKWFR